MQNYLIKNISIVNEGRITVSDILIKNERIEKIANSIQINFSVNEIEGADKYLMPGVIDDQVHFRDPGATHKATIYTEARAAVAGGVTSFMEMPNTVPPALTQELLEHKYSIAGRTSLANFSFYMGTSNDNAEEVLKTNKKKREVCGVKIFMGSSTGNMLVDNYLTLDRIFHDSELLIATHCEDERIIGLNRNLYSGREQKLTIFDHPLIRNEEACFQSALTAIQFAKKYEARLHILHLSTEKEMQLFSNMQPLEKKRITSEVCVHHLHFTSDDYGRLGYQIKCNPAIKAPQHREALWKALLDDRLDVIATDHAPHLLDEKGFFRNSSGELAAAPIAYEKAHAGLPLVQHSLLLMMYYAKQGKISVEKVVEKMCHAVATCYCLQDRGFVREGYFADLVIMDPNQSTTVSAPNLLYKCGWSPLENMRLPASITHTFINGHCAYGNHAFDESQLGRRLLFNR